MNAVVLLAGPSLQRLHELPSCDVSIAAKRAALRFPVTWAAILDSPALKELNSQLPGRPHLLTRAEYRPRLSQRCGLDVEALAEWCPLRVDLYTSVAALALAGFLGASHVDVFGADFNAAREYDGHIPAEHNYTADRWAREVSDWVAVVDWLAERGVHVMRHLDVQ